MAQSEQQDMMPTTMSELAFIFVFVFAMFAAVGNAQDTEPPVSADARLVEFETSGRVSCIYVPYVSYRHQTGQMVSYIPETGQLNVAISATDKTPAARSFLQFYWRQHQDETQTLVENWDSKNIYVRYNLDGPDSTTQPGKPYLYLNEKGRTAVFYAINFLNRVISRNFSTHKRNNATTITDIPEFTSKNFLIFHNHDEFSIFFSSLITLNDILEKEYNCRLFYDLFNIPERKNPEIYTLFSGMIPNELSSYEIAFKNFFLDEAHKPNHGLVNSYVKFPNYIDTTE
jgi:hypothetical protein